MCVIFVDKGGREEERREERGRGEEGARGMREQKGEGLPKLEVWTRRDVFLTLLMNI